MKNLFPGRKKRNHRPCHGEHFQRGAGGLWRLKADLRDWLSSSVARDRETAWATAQRSLVAAVPSVVMPEKHNLLINPLHPDAKTLRIARMQPWRCDTPLGQGQAR